MWGVGSYTLAWTLDSSHCLSLSGQCSDHSSRALREKRESGQANALTDWERMPPSTCQANALTTEEGEVILISPSGDQHTHTPSNSIKERLISGIAPSMSLLRSLVQFPVKPSIFRFSSLFNSCSELII
eukprot:sb/3475291/